MSGISITSFYVFSLHNLPTFIERVLGKLYASKVLKNNPDSSSADICLENNASKMYFLRLSVVWMELH